MVFEHELVHFLEFYVYKESNCKKDRFKAIAYNILDIQMCITHYLQLEK
jgi:predicted SprT family Zn-dependent metalloprotease